jgi:hypothetical protein
MSEDNPSRDEYETHGEAILEYVTSVDVHQQILAMTAAAALGVWIGANYVAKQAAASLNLRPWQEAPAWVGNAEWIAWVSIGVLALCIVGWILTDYFHYRRNDE